MKSKRLSIVLVMLLGVFSSAMFLSGGSGFKASAAMPVVATQTPDPGQFTAPPGPPVPAPDAVAPEPSRAGEPDHLTHPCGGLAPEPVFQGISPLAIVPAPNPPGINLCGSGYGDIGVWQNGANSYVAMSGFARVMFHIFNVNDPRNPVWVKTQLFPSGGTASTSAFPFKKGLDYYLGVTMRGSGTGCGWFVYNVNDPGNPVQVGYKRGADWCTPHESFVSTDANGDADYAWLSMSGESGSGDKMVALDLSDLTNMVETGRYERPDRSSFIHDATVIGNRVFVAHWTGGLIILDKAVAAVTIDPPALNPVDSIRPSGFSVHHAWPTTDGNHVFIEDELTSSSGFDKVRMYNIANLNAPFFEMGVPTDSQSSISQAHNLKIQNISPGLDRLYVAWYKAGTRGFEVNTTTSPPTIVQTIKHELRTTAGSGYGGAWGVDYLPCNLDVRGKSHPTTCIYTADYEKFGLVSDALGYDPGLDPYLPEPSITDPINGQNITSCNYTIRGIAHDYYSGVLQVEVSTDNGTTWTPANGTTNWTYDWTVPGDGTYMLKVRATDEAGNIGVWATTVTVTVSGGCTVTTPTPTPQPTSTSIPSSTPVQPTSTRTNTPVQPTNTTVAPTSTRTNTAVPPTSVSSNTPVAPSSTSTSIQATSTSVQPTATPTSIGCTITFTDVPSDHTFYSFIRCLACRGIMSGYSDGTFRPGNPVTRGQISKMVSNSAGYNDAIPADRQTFEDVPASNPFWLWIERLALHSVAGGYPCGGPGEPCNPDNRPYFRPFSEITRGQIAKIVSNAAGIVTPVPSGTQTYADVPSSNPFYLYIERLTALGVMGGYQCGGPSEPCDEQNRPYFRGFANTTRGQAAKIIANTWFPNCVTPARP